MSMRLVTFILISFHFYDFFSDLKAGEKRNFGETHYVQGTDEQAKRARLEDGKRIVLFTKLLLHLCKFGSLC